MCPGGGPGPALLRKLLSWDPALLPSVLSSLDWRLTWAPPGCLLSLPLEIVKPESEAVKLVNLESSLAERDLIVLEN